MMNRLERHKKLCGLFSRLMRYPGPDLQEAAARCGELLEDTSPRAAAELDRFARFAAGESAGRLEELYTATFDLQPLCYPYVGYQLCGESQKRTLFLLRLKEVFREHGFEARGELPDHLGEVLAFLAEARDEVVREEMIRDGLLPALEKLLTGFADPKHPYGALLGSLQAFLNETTGCAGTKEVAP